MVRSDTNSLTVPLTPQELRILKQRRRRDEFGSCGSLVWLLVLIFVIISVTVATSFLITASNLHFTDTSGRLLHSELAFYAVPVMVVFISTAALLRSRRRRKNWALLACFAGANGMRLEIRSTNPNYPGLPFGKRRSRASIRHLLSPTEVLADTDGYECATGSDSDSTTHHWCFTAFRLPHPVPHLLLDAKANNGVWGTDLPETFASSQRISLGEPLDNHYQFYAPEDYGRDAFQLLPPNVIEALLSAPTIYDIEMVDDWLFRYVQSQQDLTNPATWRLLEAIANGMLGSLTPVVGRYGDSRALAETAGNVGYGPGTPVRVAPQGERLRRGVNISAFIAFAILLAYMILARLLRPPGQKSNLLRQSWLKVRRALPEDQLGNDP